MVLHRSPNNQSKSKATNEELRSELRKLNLSTKGNKSQLNDRLESAKKDSETNQNQGPNEEKEVDGEKVGTEK